MPEIIDKGSNLVSKSQLNLFGLPPTQIAAEHSSWHVVHPRNSVPETEMGMPIQFYLSGIPDYLDLKRNLLKVKFQVKTAEGNDIAADSTVAPINFISYSFIKQLKIYIGNKLVYDSQDTYFLRSYIETMINSSETVKKTQLAVGGWISDALPTTAQEIDASTNTGYLKRKDLAARSRVFEVLAPLHSDIFHQENYMLPNVDMRIEIYRNNTELVLMAFDDPAVQYALHIKSIEWMVRRVEVNKTLSLTIEKMLQRTSAKYPIKRTVVRALQIDSGTADVRHLMVYHGQLPTTMILGFVDADAFFGILGKTPFNFKNNNLQMAQAVVGGRRFPLDKALETDFTNNQFTESYWNFLNNTGFIDTYVESNGITMNDYKYFCFFLVFDFRSDENTPEAVDVISHGETRIFLKFRENLSRNIKVIAYLSFDQILRLDAGRNPIMDYNI